VPFWSDSCSRCGSVEHPPQRLRWAGVLYLILGVVITGAIGYLMVVLGTIIRHSGDPGATVRFNGGPLMVLFVYAVLSFPMVVGLTVTAMGISQIRTGRRNLKLVRVAMVLYLVLVVVGLGIQLSDLASSVTHR
jgi:hypothetical protein